MSNHIWLFVVLWYILLMLISLPLISFFSSSVDFFSLFLIWFDQKTTADSSNRPCRDTSVATLPLVKIKFVMSAVPRQGNCTVRRAATYQELADSWAYNSLADASLRNYPNGRGLLENSGLYYVQGDIHKLVFLPLDRCEVTDDL